MEEQGLFNRVVAWKQTVLQGLKDTDKASGGLSGAYVAEYLAAKDREAEILCYDIFNDASRQLTAAALWGMVTPEVAEQRASSLLQSCEEHLGSLKRIFLPGLAKQRGAYDAFTREIMKPDASELAFEDLADLQFGLAIWRQDLKRNLTIASTQEAKSKAVQQAHIKVEELIRRCLNSANTFWNQHAHELPWPLHQQRQMYSPGGLPPHSRSPMTDAPLGGESVIALYEKLSNKLALRLEAIARKYGVKEDFGTYLKIDPRHSEAVTGGGADTLSEEPETPMSAAEHKSPFAT